MSKLFLYEMQCDGIYFKYAGNKSCESGKEFHIFHEIILILGGKVELITEKLHVNLSINTIVAIPKETYHQVIIHGEENDYVRCILNFEDSKFVQYEFSDVCLFRSDNETDYFFDILKEQASSPAPNEIIVKSVLALLTSVLVKKADISFTSVNNDLVDAAVSYITDHLQGPIYCETIARRLNVSVSTLQHVFKKEMHISLYQYITKKRLIAARRLILAGQSATAVAIDMGFSDYSGFYKQYKKMFGISPSKTVTP